eukprot:2141902-Rhodomonas_salina.1
MSIVKRQGSGRGLPQKRKRKKDLGLPGIYPCTRPVTRVRYSVPVYLFPVTGTTSGPLGPFPYPVYPGRTSYPGYPGTGYVCKRFSFVATFGVVGIPTSTNPRSSQEFTSMLHRVPGSASFLLLLVLML